jgi:hypothetical protein
MTSSCPLPQLVEVCVTGGYLFKKSSLRSQSAVDTSRGRSLFEGGSGGFTGAADPPHPITRPTTATRLAKDTYLKGFIEQSSYYAYYKQYTI